MNSIKIIAALLFYFVLVLTGQGASIDVSEAKNGYLNISSAELFLDTTNQLEFENLPLDGFLPHVDKVVTRDVHSTYWYKVELSNCSIDRNVWFLEFDDPHMSHFELYVDGKKRNELGYYELFDLRDVKHKNFVFSLKIEKGDTLEVFFKIRNRVHSYLGFRLLEPKVFTNYALKEYYILGLFYGVLLILFVYNLILFFVLKDKDHFFYVVYILMGAIYAFSEDGTGFHFVWGAFPSVNKFVIVMSPILFLTSFYLYANSYVGLWDKNKKLSYAILAMIFLLLVTSWWIHYTGQSHELWWTFFQIPFILIYTGGYVAYRRGEESAKLFLWGSGLIILSIFVFLGRVYNFVPTSIFTVYIFNFGFLLNSIVLSVALAEKIRKIHEVREETQVRLIHQLEKNDKLTTKVNRELEEKVSERTVQLKNKTIELETTIDELNELKEQLYKVNSDLDVKNFRLRKEVENKTKLFIKGETLSFEDFIKLFPDTISCKVFLRDLKESNTLKCKKCGNSEYIQSDKFDRKCAKCKYPESVTANTLFHKVKFPLEKAFYIMYVTVYSKQKFTLDQLSKDIDLRKNTCWSFKKKVEEKVIVLEEQGVKDISFAELIL